MSRAFARVFFAACLAATPAAANQITSYFMELGPEDYRNSSGRILTDPGAILQQDRANFHRFGIRHAGDERDGVFPSAEMRAQIPALFRAGGPDAWALRALSGPYPGHNSTYLVFVCGSGGRISHIWVDPADGDGYRGCN